MVAKRAVLFLGLAAWGIVGCAVAASQGETKQAPSTEVAAETAPRATPGDYQAQGKIGPVTLAADFAGHTVTTPEANYESEEYVVFEVAFFGPAEAKVNIRAADFSLKLKDKKTALADQPFSYLTRSLKDPDWQPPESEQPDKKSKTGLSTGGGGDDSSKTPPKMPFELKRKMEQRVLKAVLPEGERPLPVAGLIFFQYRGKTQNMKDMELVYEGKAGSAALRMQP